MNYNHGESHFNMTIEYRAWVSMRQRCYNINHVEFKRYGKRGIRICKRWSNYENFLFDMGRKPTPNHSLGRIDNSGNYEPNNCEWQLAFIQARNRRTTKLTLTKAKQIRELFEKGKTQHKLAKMFGVTDSAIAHVTRNYTWRN